MTDGNNYLGAYNSQSMMGGQLFGTVGTQAGAFVSDSMWADHGSRCPHCGWQISYGSAYANAYAVQEPANVSIQNGPESAERRRIADLAKIGVYEIGARI